MKKRLFFVPVLVALLLIGCGGENNAEDNDNDENSENNQEEASTDSPAANSDMANQPVTYEAVVAKYGEDKVMEMYVDIQAHAEAGFLSGVLGDISTSELMEMSAEERQEYAVQQGIKKGREVAKRIGEACEANGISMQEWRAISAHANENDWRDAMLDQLNARKDELKAEMEAKENQE